MRTVAAVAVCLCLLTAGCGAVVTTPAPSTAPPTAGGTPTVGGDTTAPTSGGSGAVSGSTPTRPSTPASAGTPSRAASPSPRSTPRASPTAAPATTPAPQGAIRVVNASGRNTTLPVNATLVYERTARLLATDARGPDEVVVRPVAATPSRDPSAFFRLWGLTRPAADRELRVAAYVIDPERVVVNSGIEIDPATLAATLAHEYVHVVQFRQGVFAALRHPGGGPDARATTTAVTEGAAVLAADAYWARHLAGGPRAGERPAASVRRLYANATGVGKWTTAPYRFGYRYVRARVDDPSGLGAVYDEPPTTTEQVLHPGVDEPPAELEARAAGSGTWEYDGGERRMGELFVRVALSTALPEGRAAAGADGWGEDARLGFVNATGARGYGWVLRFDDAANATEFGDALAAYLDARNFARDGGIRSNDGRAFRAVRVDDRTVVVLAGAPGFVRGTTVRTDGDAVVVAAPGSGG